MCPLHPDSSSPEMNFLKEAYFKVFGYIILFVVLQAFSTTSIRKSNSGVSGWLTLQNIVIPVRHSFRKGGFSNNSVTEF